MQSNTIATLENNTGLKALDQKLNLHSRAFNEVFKMLSAIRYDMNQFRGQPMPGEGDMNRMLNPVLRESIPFRNNVAIREFFSDPERILTLQRWVLSTIKWDVQTFVLTMIRRLCHTKYRREHFFYVKGQNM